MGKSSRLVFFEVLSLVVRLSLVLTPCLSLSLFSQSFSRDHTGFFFLSENEKKLSSEVSALKAELDLCQADIEVERQTHQEEEKALRARVVEVEERRDAAVQEALKNVEAMKKECNGIVGSFCFLLYSNFSFS